MGYSEQIKVLLHNVSKTRKSRIGQDYPKLTLDERAELLKEFHPDYIESQKRELKIGPNQGDKVAHEVADIIESYSYCDPYKIDLTNVEYDVDVLIIGGGGAGLSAAIEAKKAGAKVLLITKLRVGDANTVMAQGGIQAADKENDTPVTHYLDVMGGGHFENTPELVKTLTENAPKTIKWLESLGVLFDKEPDGRMITIHGGGTSRKRMHSSRDYTGLEILRVVRDEFYNSDILFRQYCSTVELIKDKSGKMAGAVLLNMDNNRLSVCKAKTVILATGGMGRLHIQKFPTSNHYGATADGIVMGNRAGIPFQFLDAVQYHPTGVVFPEQILGLLVTEKVRGLGAHLLNCDGERFVYELLPRDIVASAIIREVKGRKKGVKFAGSSLEGVWLDTPLIDVIHGKGTIQRLLPAMYSQYEKCGINIDEEPILIYPTQHYQNGGLEINPNAQTSIKNLFAAGEVVGGIHGRNRLMGNSLLDIFVFGRIAGKNAAETAKEIELDELSLEHVKEHNNSVKKINISEDRKSPILLPNYID